jgi:hypothetical protein
MVVLLRLLKLQKDWLTQQILLLTAISSISIKISFFAAISAAAKTSDEAAIPSPGDRFFRNCERTMCGANKGLFDLA